MDKRQFNLRQLPVFIDEVNDEVDGETVLTLVSNGDRGVTGYLMLNVDMLSEGNPETKWEWQVAEPLAQQTMFGAESTLWDAAKRLKTAMADMVEIVSERDGL